MSSLGSQAVAFGTNSACEGAFELSDKKNIAHGAGYGSNTGFFNLSFSASASNSIYRENAEVQTNSNQNLIIIKF